MGIQMSGTSPVGDVVVGGGKVNRVVEMVTGFVVVVSRGNGNTSIHSLKPCSKNKNNLSE